MYFTIRATLLASVMAHLQAIFLHIVCWCACYFSDPSVRNEDEENSLQCAVQSANEDDQIVEISELLLKDRYICELHMCIMHSRMPHSC